MTRRRRSAPVSVLRSRLNKKLSEQQKNRPGQNKPIREDDKKFVFASISLSFMRNMNQYFYLKMALALTIVLILGISKQMGWAWSGNILESARYVVTWNMDLQYMQDRVVPAVQSIGSEDIMKRVSFFNSDDDTLLPVNGTLQSGFGLRSNPLSGKDEMHYGIDITAEKGSLVRAVLDGEVKEVTQTGNGSRIIIQHDNDWSSVYEVVDEIKVKPGDEVNQYQILGILGMQETWESPHLHFELRWNDSPIDPLEFLGEYIESVPVSAE